MQNGIIRNLLKINQISSKVLTSEAFERDVDGGIEGEFGENFQESSDLRSTIQIADWMVISVDLNGVCHPHDGGDIRAFYCVGSNTT